MPTMKQPSTTLPPPPRLPSDIPATPKGAKRLRRRFTLPDESSCTLTLVDEHHGAVGPLTARYKLTHHPKGTRHGLTVFEGSVARAPDPEDAAVELLRTLTVRPGEPGDERLSAYTPAQLSWCMHFGEALRKSAAARLGWSDATEATIHADLDVVAMVRAELKAGSRYRYRLGVLEVAARTQRAAKAALAAAVGAQCAITPAVRVGEVTRDVYLMYPLGTEFVLQLIHPKRINPIGVAERYEAPSSTEALAILDATVAKREREVYKHHQPAIVPDLPVRSASGVRHKAVSTRPRVGARA